MNTSVAAVQTPPQSVDLDEIVAGLLAPQKKISPKYFYDEKGSELFHQICSLPEYYPTRTELDIMLEHVGEIADLIGPLASLIEFGSGSSYKTRVLLQNLDLAAYVPVDISTDFLMKIAADIREDFPSLEVCPVAADFTQPFGLPSPQIMPLRNLVYFPGSTIGNFEHDAAQSLLDVMYQVAGENGALLIGVDLQKDTDVLEDAYNDSEGVTAAFNLNVLQHLNDRYGSDFELSAFQHRAFYNSGLGRIEMHLDSLRDQEVRINGATISFAAGESIHTENSHKYTLEGFAAMANTAGFEVSRVWQDEQRWFSVQYLTRK